jgi:hypothetical protein
MTKELRTAKRLDLSDAEYATYTGIIDYGFYKIWCLNGKAHREDGPAVVRDTGEQIWYDAKLGLHRLDGPAWVHPNGRKEWHVANELHRLDGPAVENPDRENLWFIDGKNFSEEEFNRHPKVNKYREEHNV